MLRAHNADGQWVDARNAMRGSSYYCPRCRDVLVVVSGSRKVIDHFRHRPESACSFGADESPEHAGKKLALFDGLRSEVGDGNVRMEYVLDDGQRPDVYFEVGGQGVAVEVQHSPIGDSDLADRTASYSSKNVAALWLPDGIKSFLNTVQVADATGLARIPLWMRRIARLTDNVAFDLPTDSANRGTELISVALELRERTIKNAQGVWVVDRYWPVQKCHLHRGVVRSDTDEYGYPRLLWLPESTNGNGLVSVRPVRMQTRREVVEARGDYVGCYRDPVQIMASDASSEFHEVLLKFWGGVGSFLSQDEKMRMWGYK